MGLVTGDQIQELQNKVVEIFNAEKAATQDMAFADPLYETTPSTSAATRAVAQGAVGIPQDTTDEDLLFEDVNYYSGLIENRELTLPLRIALSAIEDDQLGWVDNAVRAISRRMENERRRLVLANLASPGNSVLNATSFFNDSHTLGASSIDNKITVTVSSTTAPTIADMQLMIDEATARMISFDDDKGVPLMLHPDTIVVPPERRNIVFQALNGMGTPGSVSPMAPQTNSFEVGGMRVIVNPYLFGTTTVFYVASTNTPLKPFGWSDRIPPTMSATGNDSDSVVLRREMIHVARLRGARYANDPRAMVEVTVST